MALISLRNVEVRYGRITALKNFSCEIEGGSIGLLGPNGAGKSTLIKTLLGFIRPKKGSVEVFGMEMPKRYLEVRQRMGYMPEKEVISPRVSAVSFLTYCGCLYGMSRVDAMERAHEVLNYVGMDDNRYRPTETYSTGMLQRVKFGAALIHDPKLLLLDEPTNGLDPDGRIKMLELIRNLPKERDITIILSSHLLPDVEYVCDHLIIIGKGEKVRDGAIADITAVRDGVFEVRVKDREAEYLAALESNGFGIRQQFNGNLMVTKPPEIDISVFFKIARDQNTHVRHLVPLRASLEDAFMQAMGRRDADGQEIL